jgi:ribosomal protein L11 methyltransferase
LADGRRWPALAIRSHAVDDDGGLEGLVAAALHDHPVLAIHDLHSPPLPPGGLWDPTAPPPPEPPPTTLRWQVCFAEASARDDAAAAVRSLGLELDLEAIELDDEDWVARSQRALTAVTAGRFIVAPPWDVPQVVPPGREVIVIEPSMGFGTGHHQTTRLCLAAMSDLELAGRRVVDLGTGSGVLALAASRLGARLVHAIDIDADAIEAARRSAALNPAVGEVVFEVGDVFAGGAAPADVVLANLTGAMLITAAEAITALVGSAGVLVVSGFMHDERGGVEAALGAFDVVDCRQEDEWCAAVLRRH